MKTFNLLIFAALLLFGAAAQAQEIVIDMHYLTPEGAGKKIGTITARSSAYGTILVPELEGLSPGLHGFHVHENADCGPMKKQGSMAPGLAAGGHYDPEGTGKHAGPYGEGHLGDLPALFVDQNGRATHPVLAPRIDLEDLKGRAIIIHAGGDTYSDEPELGGGGDRIACGVVEK